MKEKGDSLKNFEKRIKQNEQTTKKIYDLIKKKINRNRKFSRFDKNFRFDKNSEISKNMIQKIMNKMTTKETFKNEIQSFRIKESDNRTFKKPLKLTNNFLTKKDRFRSCRFCDDLH